MGNAAHRPENVVLSGSTISTCNSRPDSIVVTFNLPPGIGKELMVSISMTGFVTHSNHMNQRMIILDTEGFKPWQSSQQVTVTGPPNSNVAPPGNYLLCVIVDGALNDKCKTVKVSC